MTKKTKTTTAKQTTPPQKKYNSKFSFKPITISKEIYNAIQSDKAQAKKNGVKLTNKDILLKALQFYFNQPKGQ